MLVTSETEFYAKDTEKTLITARNSGDKGFKLERLRMRKVLEFDFFEWMWLEV